MATTKVDSGKAYHRVCTGEAAKTVAEHSVKQNITFFAACFCPFVQRVWIALQYLEIPYQYYEVDPYDKPKDLLEVSPKGLVPGFRFDSFSPPRTLNESVVILEFLEDSAAVFGNGKSLLPPKDDAYARALVRLQCDHVNRSLVPSFYRYLQAQSEESVLTGAKEYLESLQGLVALLERSEREAGSVACGLWAEDGVLSLLDAMAGPWLFRSTNVLRYYRGFELPKGNKFRSWFERLFAHPCFKTTASTEELYLDSYERYAYNRPNTSLVANAINQGRALP